MALTQLQLCNLACSAIGAGTIDDLSETSVEAEQCNLWYEPVRDMVFRAAPWQSLEAQSRLTLTVERDQDEDWVATDPTPGWAYAYALPANMIQPRYLADFRSFKLGSTNGTRTLTVNLPDPILIYTANDVAIADWDSGLVQAIWSALAAHIAIKCTGQESKQQSMWQIADDKVRTARAQDANARGDLPYEQVPEWLAARGADSLPSQRFVFPPGAFSLMTGTNLG